MQRKVSCSPFVKVLRSTATGALMSCVPGATTFHLLTGRHFWIAIYRWLSDFLKNTIFNYLGYTARHIAVVNALWLTAIRSLLHWILSTTIHHFGCDINMLLAMKATIIGSSNCLCCTHPNVLWGVGTAAEYFFWMLIFWWWMMNISPQTNPFISPIVVECLLLDYLQVCFLWMCSRSTERSWNPSTSIIVEVHLVFVASWLVMFVVVVIHSEKKRTIVDRFQMLDYLWEYLLYFCCCQEVNCWKKLDSVHQHEESYNICFSWLVIIFVVEDIHSEKETIVERFAFHFTSQQVGSDRS